MAYNRRYWRRYYRRYYRGKYSNSYWKTRMTRNFKASANNMTQGGTFNVSSHAETALQLPAPQQGTTSTFNYDKLDVPQIIANSDMHGYLSNVFDQYRVEKITIRIRAIGNNKAGLVNPSILFSCVDRTDFADNLPLTTIRTYGSYRESQVSGAKDISPTHTVYIGQSNLIEWSTYTDTKNRVSFPSVIWGVNFANVSEAITVNASIEIDAMIRYRGVRLDTRTVNPNLPPPAGLLFNKVFFIRSDNASVTDEYTTELVDTGNEVDVNPHEAVLAIRKLGANGKVELRYQYNPTITEQVMSVPSMAVNHAMVYRITVPDENTWYYLPGLSTGSNQFSNILSIYDLNNDDNFSALVYFPNTMVDNDIYQ